MPLNPLRLVRLITLVADEPLGRLTEVGFAEIEKSPVVVDVMVAEMEMECDSVPLDPVIVTV